MKETYHNPNDSPPWSDDDLRRAIGVAAAGLDASGEERSQALAELVIRRESGKLRANTWTGLVRAAEWRLIDSRRREAVRRKALRRFERRARAGPHGLRQEEGPDPVVVEAMRRGLRKLSSDEHEVLYQAYVRGMSLREIARKNGWTLAKTRALSAEALDALSAFISSRAATEPELAERVASRNRRSRG